jgi:hypothetical protein
MIKRVCQRVIINNRLIGDQEQEQDILIRTVRKELRYMQYQINLERFSLYIKYNRAKSTINIF